MLQKNMLEEELYQKVIKRGSFLLKSGQTSNTYADFRVVPHYPFLMTKVCYELSKLIQHENEDFVVVGIPLGGVPFATLVASILKKPLWLVREQEKQHGATEDKPMGKKIILIEDVITKGTSVVQIAKHLQEKGCTILQIITLLDRRANPGPLNGIPVTSLLDHHFLVKKSEISKERAVNKYPDSSEKQEVETERERKGNRLLLHQAKERTQSSLIAAIDVPNIDKALNAIRLVACFVFSR